MQRVVREAEAPSVSSRAWTGNAEPSKTTFADTNHNSCILYEYKYGKYKKAEGRYATVPTTTTTAAAAAAAELVVVEVL